MLGHLNAPASCAYLIVFTAHVNCACLLRMFTAHAHCACSLCMITAHVHCVSSLCMITAHVHCVSLLCMITAHVHCACSLRMQTCTVYILMFVISSVLHIIIFFLWNDKNNLKISDLNILLKFYIQYVFTKLTEDNEHRTVISECLLLQLHISFANGITMWVCQ